MSAGKIRRQDAEGDRPAGGHFRIRRLPANGNRRAAEAEIHWESPRQAFAGHVRYCVYREIGYFIGVEFEPESKWSKETYQPQHLLDLRRLMGRGKK